MLDTLDQESKMGLLSNGAEQLRGDVAADPRLWVYVRKQCYLMIWLLSNMIKSAN